MLFDYTEFRSQFVRLKRKPAPSHKNQDTLYTGTFQLPLLLYDSVAADLYLLIRDRMRYDDALVFQKWRLEYLCLERGFVHYRLYNGKNIVGLKDVRSATVLNRTQRSLSAYLAGLGFTVANTRLVVAGAKTPLDAEKHGLPRLW